MNRNYTKPLILSHGFRFIACFSFLRFKTEIPQNLKKNLVTLHGKYLFISVLIFFSGHLSCFKALAGLRVNGFSKAKPGVGYIFLHI